MSKLFWNIASSSPNRIGAITCQYTILQNHVALNGDIKEQASINYTELLDFFRENNLIAESLEDYNNNKSLMINYLILKFYLFILMVIV
jgi:hypothetical protein